VFQLSFKVTVTQSTHPGYELVRDDAKFSGGRSAGTCYMPDDYDALKSEPTDKTAERAESNIANKHHSVFDHCSYSVMFEGIPKILAMILNNEKAYATSEKSARYTKMKPSEQERVLYEKWIQIFQDLILQKYPDTDETKVKKLAQENARYLISVFTPTSMEYTATFGQWSKIVYWFRKFIAEETSNVFFNKLKPYMEEFVENMKFLEVEGLNDEAKGGELSLFDRRQSRQEHFGETYCTTYLGSFAQLAQAHRHRTLDYKMVVPDVDPKFFIPPIIADSVELMDLWLGDIESVVEFFPQGMLISIRERGTYEKFILKTKERLCSGAQLEISMQTYNTLQNFIGETSMSDLAVFSEIKLYDHGARCASGYKCTNPCKWGKNQLERLI
jgi:hypothetical protein